MKPVEPVEPVEPPTRSYFSTCGLPLDERGYPLTQFSNPAMPRFWQSGEAVWESTRRTFFADMDRLHAAILQREQALEAAAADYREKAGQFHDSEAAPRDARFRVVAAKEAYATARTVAALEAAEVAFAQAEREQIIADRILTETTAAAKAASFVLQRAEENLKLVKVSLHEQGWIVKARKEHEKEQKAIKDREDWERGAQQRADAAKAHEDYWRKVAEAPDPPVAKPRKALYRRLSPIAQFNKFYPRED